MKLFSDESMIAMYKSFMNYNSDAIFILSVDGDIVEVNQVATETFGYTHEELYEVPLKRIIVPDDAGRFCDRFLQSLEKKTVEFKVNANHKDGSILHLYIKNVPLVVGTELTGIISIVRDITEHKQLEASLKESEERYRKVVEWSPKGIVIHRDGQILFANRSAKHIFNEDDCVGKSIFFYIHPEFQSVCRQRLSEVKVGKELPFIEIKMNGKDGKGVYIEIGGVVIDFDGSPAMLSLFSDITDRKMAEEALQKSEERYRLLANNSLDLIQLVDLDGIVTYASPSHKTVLGYPAEEYVGQWILHQPGDGVHDPFDEIFAKMVTAIKPFTYEIHRKHQKGHEIWIEIQGTPIFNEDGEFKHMMIVGHDITERKQRQEILEFKANHDHLTLLPNRSLFGETLKQALLEANRYRRNLAVMFMDMDNFKHVNDTFGHDTGDELLKQFAARVKRCVRDSDMVARLGGDEFVILFPQIKNEEEVIGIAERILQALNKPWDILDYELTISSSIGIAFSQSADKSHTLLKRADLALYRAKGNGKSTYCIYGQDRAVGE